MTDKGSKDKLKGTLKEAVGNLTKDNQTKTEGIIDKSVGKAKEITSKAKEKTSDLVEDSKKNIK